MPGNPQLLDGVLKPGEEWTNANSSWRLIAVSSGEAYWLGDSANRFIVDGELILVPPGCVATIRASQLGSVSFHRLEFELDATLGFFTLDERHFLETTPASRAGGVSFVPAGRAEAQTFNHLVRGGSEFTPLQHRVELFGLLLNLLQEIAPYRPRSFPQGTTATDRFRELVTRISEAEFLQYSHRELALLCRCGHRHLDRLFRMHFGASAREMQARLAQLKTRLDTRELQETHASN